MNFRLIERIKETYGLLRIELQSYAACLAGWTRVRVFFDKRATNKLEFGVGPSAKKPGFITSDFSLKTDYPFDLRVGLPFPDESLDLIYSEHVLEHFVFKDFVKLLNECHRTLRPGGRISIAIPDPAPFINAYLDPRGDEIEIQCSYDYGLRYASRIDYVNYIFHMDDTHKYLNDRESIIRHLKDVGFEEARLREFDPSLDQEKRRLESIYAEAIKRRQ